MCWGSPLGKMQMNSPMRQRWYEITFLVPPVWGEALPGFLQEQGFCGLWVEDEKKPPFRTMIRTYLLEHNWSSGLERNLGIYLDRLSVFVPVADQKAIVQKRIIEEQDWASAWLPFFEPLRIGPVWIRPRGKTVVLCRGQRELIVSPGQAFGTGHHETTQLCLESILHLRPSMDDHESVLDLGTGTGILAMFAAALGLRNITAIDNDPVAVETARHNVQSNAMERFVDVSNKAIHDLPGRFRLIVANLSASMIRALCDLLSAHLDCNGWLVVSGILVKEADDIKGVLRSMGLELVQEKRKNEWACLVLRGS